MDASDLATKRPCAPHASRTHPRSQRSAGSPSIRGCHSNDTVIGAMGMGSAKLRLNPGSLYSAFADALVRAQAEGEIPQGDHRAQAKLLVCIVQGMNVLAKSRPSRLALQSIVDAAFAGVAPSVPTMDELGCFESAGNETAPI